MIEMCELDRVFGKPTDEEWVAYYKVRRIRTSWDIAGYLAWDNKPYFMSWEEAEDYKYDGDGPEKVTKSEFLFMCEYVESEDIFNTDTSIWSLMEQAHEIVLQVRKCNYKNLSAIAKRIINRTIMLDRYGTIKKEN